MKKSATPASLRDLCLSHFKILGIPIAPNDLDTMLERADKETLSHLMSLDLLLGQQAAARRERSVEYRIREARFEERKTLETFDWKFNPQIDRLIELPVKGLQCLDRKSTRLNSSHDQISYAVFC